MLKSNITLHLEKGATLLGSADHGDYPAKTEFHLPDLQPLVSAENASNVAITGEGTIDGAGESWWQEIRSLKDHGILGNGHPRPKLIVFDHCKHVLLEGISARKGLTVGYASVSGEGVDVKVEEGHAVVGLVGAKISLR